MSDRTKNWMLCGAAATALIEFIIILVLVLSPPAEKISVQEISAERLSAPSVPIKDIVPTGEIESDLEEGQEEEETESGESEPTVLEKEKPAGERSAPEIMADAKIVAHGLGTIADLRTPNCMEAFEEAYANGVRVFEADLRLTRDCQVVLRHDWWPDTWQKGIDWARIPTRDKFLSEKIMGKYTPMSFKDLLLLMEKYPDICVVTDTKFTESDVFYIQFDAMVADAHELGLTYLFDRIFIQVYSGNMKTAVNNVYPFPHYIYTLYQDEDAPFKGTAEDFRKRAAYAKERGIEGLAVNYYWWKPEFAKIANEYGIKVYVHTVNNPDTAKRVLAEGAGAVYTDSIRPKDLA